MDQATHGSNSIGEEAARIDNAMRRILKGDDAPLADAEKRLRDTLAGLSETALLVKKERDLAVSTLKVARSALHSDDPEHRLDAARLIAQCLKILGEEPL